MADPTQAPNMPPPPMTEAEPPAGGECVCPKCGAKLKIEAMPDEQSPTMKPPMGGSGGGLAAALDQATSGKPE